MKYIEKFNEILIFIIIITILISCTDKFKKELLPAKYKLTKTQHLNGILYDVYIYEICENFPENGIDLLGFPKSCNGARCTSDCEIMEWFSFIDLESNEVIRLQKMITNNNEYYQYEPVKELLRNIRYGNNIKFSCCYYFSNDVQNNKYKFYNLFSFLDMDRNLIYVFDYKEDPW